MTATVGPGTIVQCIAHPEEWKFDVRFKGHVALPSYLGVYTVREVLPCQSPGHDHAFYRLVEIINRALPRLGWKEEPGYETKGFSPLDDDNLEVFRALERDVPMLPVVVPVTQPKKGRSPIPIHRGQKHGTIEKNPGNRPAAIT